MDILHTESIILSAFGHTKAYVGIPIDDEVCVETSFNDKGYLFIYTRTKQKKRIREDLVTVFELTRMEKHGH